MIRSFLTFTFSTFSLIARDRTLWEPCYQLSTTVNPISVQKLTFIQLQTPKDYGRCYSPPLSDAPSDCSPSFDRGSTTPLINAINLTYHKISTSFDPTLSSNKQRLVPVDRQQEIQWTEVERKRVEGTEWVANISDL